VEPLAKRAKRGRRKSGAGNVAPDQAGDEHDRLRIGFRKMKAIKAILEGATAESFSSLQMHLVWAGDFAYSALSDDSLALSFLWPSSLPDPESLPCETSALARDVAAKCSQSVGSVKFTMRPLAYEEVLTVEQHRMILEKAFSIFEDEALTSENLSARARLRPKTADWIVYRTVIQHWTQTIRHCCRADLSVADFEEMEKAVLYGDAMDAQIVAVLKRWPKVFHVGMIPDIKTELSQTTSSVDKELLEAHRRRRRPSFYLVPKQVGSGTAGCKSKKPAAEFFRFPPGRNLDPLATRPEEVFSM